MNSNWASPISHRTPKEAFNFCSLAPKASSQNSGGPIGHPRRVKPRRAMGMSERRVDWEASASGGMNNKDLLWFTCSPRAGPSSSTMRRATERSSGEPTKVPSSIYEVFRERPGTSALIFSMNGWRVGADRSNRTPSRLLRGGCVDGTGRTWKPG